MNSRQGSGSSNNSHKQTEEIFKILLSNPEKRALVLDALTKQGLFNQIDTNMMKLNSKKRPLKRLQKKDAVPSTSKTNPKYQSPSGLMRKRSLKLLESDSHSEDNASEIANRPYEKILHGVTVYCEVRSGQEDRSTAIKAIISSMGAVICDTFTRDVTHLIFKDGSFQTYQKAKLLKVHIVSVLWVEAVRRHKCKVPEILYPVVGMGNNKSNLSLVCQQIEQDYQETLKEEKGKQKDRPDHLSCLNKNGRRLWSDTSSNVSLGSRAPTPSTDSEHNFNGNPHPHKLIFTSDSESDTHSINKHNRLLPEPQTHTKQLPIENPSELTEHKRQKLNSGLPTTNININCVKKTPEIFCSTPRRSSRLSMHRETPIDRRKTLTDITLQSINENLNDSIFDASDKLDKIKEPSEEIPTNNDKKSRKSLRKLYRPDQSLDESLFNWNNEPSTTKLNEVNLNQTVCGTRKNLKAFLKPKLPETEPKKQTEVINNLDNCKKKLFARPKSNVPCMQPAQPVQQLQKSTEAVAAKTSTSSNNKIAFHPLNLSKTNANSLKKPSKAPIEVESEVKAKVKPTIQATMKKENDEKLLSSSLKSEKVKPSSSKLVISDLSTKMNTESRSTIVCTYFVRDEVQAFNQIVKRLGGFDVEDEVTERTSHVVASAPSRTINMLRAVARGCWILNRQWLYMSLEAGKWLDEKDYELTEFSPFVQKNRIKRQKYGSDYSVDIFKDCGDIYVCRASTPRHSDLEELLSLCGASVVKSVDDANIVVGEFLKDKNEGIFVSEKWVLDSITNNEKKPFKNYRLKRRPSITY